MGKAEHTMSQDESKFDTMRLIQGAEASDLYSLESIIEEFSDASKSEKAAEKAEKQTIEQPREQNPTEEAEKAEVQTEKPPEPESTAEPVEHAEEALPIDEDQPPPAYENLSESQMADAIAQAVARSTGIDTDDAAVLTEPTAAAQAPEQPQQAPVKKPEPSAPEAPAKPTQPMPQTQQPVTPEPVLQQSDPERNPAKTNAAPGAATTKKAEKKAEAKHPGTEHQKIPRSHVKSQVGTSEYIGELVKNVRRRQSMALPKPGTSLRGTEKRLGVFVGIEGLLSPVRYVIILLMLLCIGGRTVDWMTLGFMRGSAAVTISLVAVLAAMIASWQSVVRGVKDLWYCKASYETFLLLTTVLTTIEALTQNNQKTFLPLIAISWAVAGTAEYMHDRASLSSLRAVITGRGRVGVRTAADKWEHTDVIGKAPVTTAGFVRHQAQPDVWHSGMGIFLPVLTIVAVIVSAYLSVKAEMNYLTVLVTILDVAMPVALAVCCARPYNLLSRALRGRGAVAGWFGLQGLSGKKAMLVYDNDLFPNGTMQQMGVRAYLPMDPRELVSMGASMALRANVGFQAVFTKLLRDMNGEIYDVSRFQIQETGLEGYIHQQLVHLGSYQYMQLMGVTLPKRAPKYGVYIAINRELAGLFGVKYQVSNGAVGGFRRIVREPRLTPLLVTRNFCVNPGFVEHWFKAPVTQMGCPKAETRRALSEPSLLSRGVTCGFVFQEGISAYSRTVSGARRVYRMGLWLTVFAALIGLVLTVQTILAIASGGAIISAQRLVVMNLILYLVVEVWARIAVRG